MYGFTPDIIKTSDSFFLQCGMAAGYQARRVPDRKRPYEETSSAPVISNFMLRHERHGIRHLFPQLSRDTSPY
jgi:hypothetical protein